MVDNVAIMTFPENSVTYEAYSKLGQGTFGNSVTVSALVERDASGRLTLQEGDDTRAGNAMLGGSLIGMLIGVLGGPLGLLLGWTVGAATGALVDSDRLENGEDLITRFAASVPPGGNAIVADVSESDPGPLDTFVQSFGGTISRAPREELISELEAQQEAADEARKAARKAMREHKRAERKEKDHERVESLKARFQ
ncbi:MAG: DUF1269 domain-containing protein [Actinomycetales bacterium]